jgi:glycosyltransferase involved in cell wall biosynthesis
MRVVAKGVDLERFAPALSRPPGAHGVSSLVFGFAGQLVARKRVDALLTALARLDVPWNLRIAGEGPLLPALRTRCEALGMTDRVHFDGFVEDFCTWLGGIDALVLPSFVEGWGYVLAEAAAAGRALVAYDASSVAEVTPGAAGALLADPQAPDGLLHRLRELAGEGPEGCRRRGLALRAHAERHLGIDRMIDELDQVLLQEITRRRAR